MVNHSKTLNLACRMKILTYEKILELFHFNWLQIPLTTRLINYEIYLLCSSFLNNNQLLGTDMLLH